MTDYNVFQAESILIAFDLIESRAIAFFFEKSNTRKDVHHA